MSAEMVRRWKLRSARLWNLVDGGVTPSLDDIEMYRSWLSYEDRSGWTKKVWEYRHDVHYALSILEQRATAGMRMELGCVDGSDVPHPVASKSPTTEHQ